MKRPFLPARPTGTVSREATCDEPRSLVSPGPHRLLAGKSITNSHTGASLMVGRLGFAGQFIYFLQQLGVSADDSFSFHLGSVGMGFVGTILSWLLMNKFGRRTIMVYGCFGLTALYVIRS